MTPEELGRVVHAEHVRDADAKIEQGAYVPPSWDRLRQDERDCYIRQALAVRDALGAETSIGALHRKISDAFNFDDTGHTPCPVLPWGDCIHDFDDPEPTAPPWNLDCCTGDVLSPKCWDNRLSPAIRSIFASVSVGIPLFLMREAPAPPCEPSRDRAYCALA